MAAEVLEQQAPQQRRQGHERHADELHRRRHASLEVQRRDRHPVGLRARVAGRVEQDAEEQHGAHDPGRGPEEQRHQQRDPAPRHGQGQATRRHAVDDPRREDRADDAAEAGEHVDDPDRTGMDAGLHQPEHRDVEDGVDGEVAGGREHHHGAEVGPTQHVAQALGQVGDRLARRPVRAGREVGADPRERHERHGERDGVEDERHRAPEPDQEGAERAAHQGRDVVARLVLAQGRGQLVPTDDRAHGGRLRRTEDAGAHAGEQRRHHQVPQAQLAHEGGDGDQSVDHGSRAAREHHQPLAVAAVDDDARRQQGRHHAEHEGRSGQARQHRGAGQAVADQREGEHAHGAAELADRLADPEGGEVAVVGERAIRRHTRNI